MPLKGRTALEHFQFRRSCKFVGSLAITLLHGEERQHYVNEKLLEMKYVGKGISVVILVTDEGVKILKDDESAVKMAHGITRIAFSTCQPEKKLFAYVAKSQTSEGVIITQAHMFKAKKGQHTQELSAAISKSFKIAYTRNSTNRANRVNLFEMEAKDKKEIVIAKKKRWAKGEMANGHEHSCHALRAKGVLSKKNVSSDVQKLLHDLDEHDKKTNLTASEDLEENPKTPEVDSKDCNSHVSNEDPASNDNDNDNKSNNTNGVPVVPIPQPRKVSTKKNQEEYNGLHTSNAINTNNDNNNINSTPAVIPIPKPRQKLSTAEDEGNEITRKVSRNSTALEDWDIIRLSSTSADNYPQKVAVPVTKFGALDEEGENNDNLEEEVFATGKVQSNIKQSNEQQSNSTFDLSRLTMTENQILQDAEWYQLGFSREIAETILQNRPVGSFFVRNSLSNPGCYVITIKVPASVKERGCLNYLIENTPDRFLRIRGFEPKFPSLLFLIAHYSSATDEIPCRLYTVNSNPLFFLPQEDVDELDNCQEVQIEFYDSDECSDADYENFCSNTGIMQELDQLQLQG